MSRDVFADLRSAVADYNDSGLDEDRFRVVDAARRFVSAVNGQAQAIDYYRQSVTPTEQALSAILNPT
jgi:hypothetical protein